jgi:hypothetical protein
MDKPKALFQVLRKDGSVFQSFVIMDQTITFGCDTNCDVTISRKKYNIKHHATLFFDSKFARIFICIFKIESIVIY